MASKLTINKDIVNRSKFNKTKNQYRVYKLLLNDSYLPIQNRQITAYSYLYSSNELVLKSSIKNKCILTGRNKSVYSFFKLTRMIFKGLAIKGNLNGVTKHSW